MNTPQTTSKSALQKLVTIYLDNSAYGKGKVIVGSYANKHGLVEEHLSDLLAQGWRIAAIDGIGGGAGAMAVRGWITVLLEKQSDL